MLAKVNRIAGWSLAAALLTAPAASALPPESAPPDLDRRWIPSIAPTAGITLQNMDSSVASLCARGGPPQPNLGDIACGVPSLNTPGPLRPANSGTDLAISPYVGGSFQLLSPVIPVPGRPRLFVDGEVMAYFAADRDIAKEGDPGQITFPSPPIPNAFPAAALGGAGSKTSSTLATFGYGAGIGIAFPIHFRERRIWVKPSAGWLRYTVDVEGLVVAGLKNDPLISPPPPAPPFGNVVREVRLEGHDSLVVNAIGPGIEFELETVRFGPIGTTLFLGGDAFRVLGKRSLEFSQSTMISGDGMGSDSYAASWSYEADPWVFRTGIGMRFHWIGSGR